MKVSELIAILEALPNEDIEVEAFGPQASGTFAARPVIGVSEMNRKTVTRGDEGPIIFINTSVYNR